MKRFCVSALLLIGVFAVGLPLHAQQPSTSPAAPQVSVLSTADFLATLQAPPETTQPPVQWMSCTATECRDNCLCGGGCFSVCTSTTRCTCTCRSTNGLPCQV